MVEPVLGSRIYDAPRRLVPVSLREANRFVELHHRHSAPVRGCLFCVGLEHLGEIIGVAIVGRPVARALQDGFTAEVLRVCTTGAKNACSALYGASWRGAKAMGYTRIVTYTLEREGGASLRAAGWLAVEELPVREGWDMPGRRRDNSEYLSSARMRWEQGEAATVPRAELAEIDTGQESLL